MKLRKLLAWSMAMFIPLCLYAQSPKVDMLKTGIPWAPMGVSSNGRFICGTKQYQEAYIFDSETKKLHKEACNGSKSQLLFRSITNDGTVAGLTDDGQPGLFKEGKWFLLPTPAPIFGDASSIYAINSDGSKILGQVAVKPDISKPFEVIPTLWTRKSDGTYKHESLPQPDNVIEGKPQFVSPRQMSEDGNTILGLVVSKSGKYYLHILYERQPDGAWAYSIPFLSIFCDMSKYDQIVSKKPDIKKIITAKLGTPEYFKQIEEFQKADAKWNYEMFTVWQTGKEVYPLPIVMSENGRYIASAWVQKTYKYKEGDIKLEKYQENYPVLYDIKEKVFIHFPSLKDYSPIRVTNDGMAMAVDNQVVYIIDPKEPDEPQLLQQWVKNKYNFDLMGKLPKQTKYIREPIINGNGDIIACKYITMGPNNKVALQDVFCLKLNKESSVDRVEESLVLKASPNPTKNIIQIEGAKPQTEVSIVTMQGVVVLVKQTDEVGAATIDLSTLSSGLYVLRTDGSKGIMIKKE